MDDQRKHSKSGAATLAGPPPVPGGSLPTADFGGDPEIESASPKQRDRWRNVPVFGKEANGSTLWNVVVRHSPFLLKQANIWATTEKEAHKTFIEVVKGHHEEVANKERGPAQRSAAKAIREAYDRGVTMSRAGDLKWTIRPWDEVKKERADYRETIFNLMSRERQLAEMLAGKSPTPALIPG